MCLSSTASFYDMYNWPLKIGIVVVRLLLRSADIIKMKVVADSKAAGLNNGETENFALKEKALTAGHIGGRQQSRIFSFTLLCSF